MSSTRFVLPYETVIDAAGVPIPGAQLYFYQSGTSTPLVTYSDSGLTIPNTNPVVASAGGQFGNIFLLPQAYKAVLTDSLNNQIWTADPVQGAPSSLPTRQVFTAGSANYVTPAGCRQIRVRMVGGGGGGSGQSGANVVAGNVGTGTSFGTVTAAGGGGSPGQDGGQGGTGGAGAASFRIRGGGGGGGAVSAAGLGGPSAFGGNAQSTTGTNNGAAGAVNSGGGGSGAAATAATFYAGGGGSGEYVEIIINSPAAAYAYVIGTGGAGGAGATNVGGQGGSGVIICDEFY